MFPGTLEPYFTLYRNFDSVFLRHRDGSPEHPDEMPSWINLSCTTMPVSVNLLHNDLSLHAGMNRAVILVGARFFKGKAPAISLAERA